MEQDLTSQDSQARLQSQHLRNKHANDRVR